MAMENLFLHYNKIKCQKKPRCDNCFSLLKLFDIVELQQSCQSMNYM